MVYEWIKVAVVTPDKPEVYQLAEILAIDPDTVLGKLVRVWAWADRQSIDDNQNGTRVGVTKSAIDRIGFLPGLADALIKVGWLKWERTVLIFPNFDRHNGKLSKKRLLTRQRVTQYREKKSNCNDDSVTSHLPMVLPQIKAKKKLTDRKRDGDERHPTPANMCKHQTD
ncbi:hypothetical protein L580_0739 [Serratia fonticola AU-P3(3)]|nr:hypothetical protein L580_0739 [Serratia fonticola AU-P3(3)]